ncbi:conjugal transfer protein TraH [Acinetobacter variabilis]|uniref:conjugal transfer protein TraH n=1 Tax=Acinetobacter variabilis TaxID=70346 RepID=UPI003B843BA0
MLLKQNIGKTLNNIPKTFLKPLRICCLLATVAGASQTATTGGLDSFMGDMYSNTTAPGMFQTQQRGVISGGSFVGRFGIKSINLVSFDPPRVSAGCGGINLFGGSFSFINAKELTQLLRAVAQNALGLLFQLGLNAISQPLSSLLTTWSAKLQEMNSLLKNSCEAARKLFQIDKTGGAMLDAVKGSMGEIKTQTGGFKDYFSNVQKNFTSGWNSLRGNSPDGQATSRADKAIQELPNVGNVTWRAINATDSYKAIMPNTGGSEVEAKIMLMNVIGTEVFNASTQTTDGDNACSTGSGQCDPKPARYNSVIGISDLISPQDTKPFYACQTGDTADEGCQKLPLNETARLSTYFKGVALIVNRNLYGIESPKENLDRSLILTAISSGKGIVGKAGKPNIESVLSPSEKAFYASVNTQLIGYISKVNNQPDQVVLIAEHIRPIIIHDMAVKLAKSLEEAAVLTFNGPTVKASTPAAYDANLERWRNEIAKYQMTPQQLVDQFNALDKMVGTVANSLPINPIAVNTR